jgi:hypothetical protein
MFHFILIMKCFPRLAISTNCWKNNDTELKEEVCGEDKKAFVYTKLTSAIREKEGGKNTATFIF